MDTAKNSIERKETEKEVLEENDSMLNQNGKEKFSFII